MSENQPKARPWHGHVNPMDALHDWIVKELAALRDRIPNAVSEIKTPTASGPARDGQGPAVQPPRGEPPKPAEPPPASTTTALSNPGDA